MARIDHAGEPGGRRLGVGERDAPARLAGRRCSPPPGRGVGARPRARGRAAAARRAGSRRERALDGARVPSFRVLGADQRSRPRRRGSGPRPRPEASSSTSLSRPLGRAGSEATRRRRQVLQLLALGEGWRGRRSLPPHRAGAGTSSSTPACSCSAALGRAPGGAWEPSSSEATVGGHDLRAGLEGRSFSALLMARHRPQSNCRGQPLIPVS